MPAPEQVVDQGLWYMHMPLPLTMASGTDRSQPAAPARPAGLSSPLSAGRGCAAWDPLGRPAADSSFVQREACPPTLDAFRRAAARTRVPARIAMLSRSAPFAAEFSSNPPQDWGLENGSVLLRGVMQLFA
jgi:hypothetical protein